MHTDITLTDSARERIDCLYDEHGKMVRLSITAGGCQGFNKVWDLDDGHDPDDLIISCGSGSLLIDRASLEIINGATVDYKRSLAGSMFIIEIPSAISQCGCGSSFSI